MARSRRPNLALRRTMGQAGWNGPALATALREIARESGLSVSYDRTTVAHWLAGTQPRPPGPQLLEAAFSRRLGRAVLPHEIGLPAGGRADAEDRDPLENGSPLDALALLHDEILRSEKGAETIQHRMYALGWLPDRRNRPAPTAPGSDASPTVPPAPVTGRGAGRATPGRTERVGSRHIEAVNALSRYAAQHYDAFGGAAARSLLTACLRDQIMPWLRQPSTNGHHRALLSATSQLLRLLGRTHTDDNAHGHAQRHYRLAYLLAAEASDPIAQAMGLRDQSTQAGALGHHRYAAQLSEAATLCLPASAGPAVRAFALAQQAVSTARLNHAAKARRELDEAQEQFILAATEGGPDRYPEPALLYQSAQVHRVLGAPELALSHLRASLRARPVTEHRTIGVSLLQLAQLELDSGNIHAARLAYEKYLDRHHTNGSPATAVELARLRGRLSRLGRTPVARAR
ncbi:hypothetical protein [Streptomyces sp. NBC_00094]|uniref:hypothetical protein n=1 Tax=Streptomyces sp. NBC_00094 TaxID=2903620 RepID=UPI0022546916|nr:hypothetical protein [Streptomyces sp. NBC_00094]MCX5389198.1 hypothetical protein [Streptomyces sp. NBC_00094]